MPSPAPLLSCSGRQREPSLLSPGPGYQSLLPQEEGEAGAQERQGFRPPLWRPRLPVWRWAHLGFWDAPDDALSAVVRLSGFSACCLSMSGCGLENPQAPAATLSSCPGGRP